MTPALNLTFGYLPFFVLGYVTGREQLKNIVSSKKLCIFLPIAFLFILIPYI